MQIIRKIPRLFRFLAISVSINFVFFNIMRLIFWLYFKNPADPVPTNDLLKSLYIGLKFDMRLSLLINLPILVLSFLKPINIFKKRTGKWLWTCYLTLVNIIVVFLYFVDFGHYSYLESRLDATAVRFLQNPLISIQMIIETYPVAVLSIVLLLFTIIIWYYISSLITRFASELDHYAKKWKKAIVTIICIFIYLFGIYGNFSYYQLRWSEAFFSNHSLASALALNPILYVYDTFKYRNATYSIENLKKYYKTMAAFLGVTEPDDEALNFVRIAECDEKINMQPNIIMIFLESFVFYKTGILGNPLNPTPHFDSIAKKSYFFKRFYTPHPGTARSVFATITGIPDIELNKTSTRNPLVVRQHTIINAFKDHEKFYFIGGSANWGNIRGLLKHNIPDLHLYEEGSYSSPRLDVWGISDLCLFEEANNIIREVKNKPFFAIIQTAGNHRPYTIPDDSRGFKLVQLSKEEVKKYGFSSVEEFNSFRFMDFSLGMFFAWAQNEDYFDNTIFIAFGDHGLPGSAEHMLKSEDQLALAKYHVPMFIYSPLFEERSEAFDKVASQVDLLPTLASLTSTPYFNSTMGRNLFDKQFDSQRYAFTIIHRSNPVLGLLSDKYYFQVNSDGTDKRLHSYYSNTPRDNLKDNYPKIAAEMEHLCLGIYETARYMSYHNSPEKVRKSLRLQKSLPALK